MAQAGDCGRRFLAEGKVGVQLGGGGRNGSIQTAVYGEGQLGDRAVGRNGIRRSVGEGDRAILRVHAVMRGLGGGADEGQQGSIVSNGDLAVVGGFCLGERNGYGAVFSSGACGGRVDNGVRGIVYLSAYGVRCAGGRRGAVKLGDLLRAYGGQTGGDDIGFHAADLVFGFNSHNVGVVIIVVQSGKGGAVKTGNEHGGKRIARKIHIVDAAVVGVRDQQAVVIFGLKERHRHVVRVEGARAAADAADRGAGTP